MASTEQTYREAARENLLRAELLFNGGEFFLCHYLSGLAVECHLRAHLLRNAPEWVARHDIKLLANKSKFYNVVPPKMADSISQNIAVVALRWRSNHRYFSERAFRDYMTEIKAEFKNPGDSKKNQARTILNAASDIIRVGEQKW